MTKKPIAAATAVKPKPTVAAAASELEDARIVQHPDGYYWLADEGRNHEVGPFATLEDALADMMSAEASEIEPGESLQEAEAELGIADWIDPETAAPAEEERPRLEEH